MPMGGTFFKQFGGKVTKELIEEYQKSDNWYKGCFQNLEETNVDMSARKLPSILYKQLFTKKIAHLIQRFQLYLLMSACS